MKRWQIIVHYLDRPSRIVQFEDLHSLGTFQRQQSPRCWRMDVPERLPGPAMSREEYEDGLRVTQMGREWALYEPVKTGT